MQTCKCYSRATETWLKHILLLPSFADRDMYARFVGFGVGHDIQYHQSITNIKNQDTEEDNIIDETQILGNYMKIKP